MGSWLMNLDFAASAAAAGPAVEVAGPVFFVPTMGHHAHRLRFLWWAVLATLGVGHGG